MIYLHKYGKDHPMTFHLANYAENGNLYVGLLTNEEGWQEPWSNLTVNLSAHCEDNCAFIDSNNNGVEIIDWLMQNNLGELTGREMPSGWCRYLEFRFNMDELMKHVAKDDRLCVSVR